MCVGLSAKVVKLDKGMALIDTQGVQRQVSAQLLTDLEPGDYVMVHAGIAIAKIQSSDTEEAHTVLTALTNKDN
ncbi:MAG: HypC/HybG/HupF family hydrogenase formation chaperone [Desulfovibrionaceae bacterium]|nr:HypC/HybG/HupF family hydrogenase formation chaperone [Desulfovibrionaceae bacterium]